MGKKIPKKNKLSKKLGKQREKTIFQAENSLPLQLYNAGKMNDAVKAADEELIKNPNAPTALYVSGLVSLRYNQLLKASDFFIRAIKVKPKFADAHIKLGYVYDIIGQKQDAVKFLERALSIKANDLEALNNLAKIYYELGDYENVVAVSSKSIKVNKNNPSTYTNLACGLLNVGKLEEAEDACKKALRLDKNYAPAYKNLGAIYQNIGAVEDSIVYFRKSLDLEPDYPTFASILMNMNYLSNISQKEIYHESIHCNELLKYSPQEKEITNTNNANKENIIKIGYISSDFCEHSVSYFFEPVINSHDRKKFKVYCYSNVQNADHVTLRIEQASDGWHNISGMADQNVVDLIKGDGIDILIDLAGHTLGSRLSVFVQRPAPVQVTWLGYPNTTGLDAIDYRLTDAIADPVDEEDKLYSEQLIRLAKGFLCYQPAPDSPKISQPPCQKNGYITFGSFNNCLKVTTEVIQLWAQILNSVQNARLILKSKLFNNLGAKERYKKLFEDNGVAIDRIELLSRLPAKNDHLSLYNKIDIGLDPFPYNGTTTTFEALWMGVPVLTLRGKRHSGRVGASIMHHTGLVELVAETQEEYKELAISLAHDVGRLIKLKAELRERLKKSSLMNSQQFTRILEETYRKIHKHKAQNKMD